MVIRKKYKITIEFESSEVANEDLEYECKTLTNEFLESDMYDLSELNIRWEEINDKKK
jgi:hypothetical protein